MDYHYKVVPLREGLPIRFVMHRQRSYHFHWHKELEIFMVLQGFVHISTTRREYILHEGELFIMNCNEIHSSYYSGGQDQVLIVQIDMGFSQSFGYEFQNLCLHWGDVVDQDGLIRQLKQCLVHMILEISDRRMGYHHAVMENLHHFVSLLLRHVPFSTHHEMSSAMSESDFERLNRMMMYINQNYNERISLSQMAQEEFLSVHYMSHFFKERVGIPFMECVNLIRTQKAAELLLSHPALNMTEISFHAGFPNVKSFYRSFKKKYKTTPYHYRKRIVQDQQHTESALSGIAAEELRDEEIFNSNILCLVKEFMG